MVSQRAVTIQQLPPQPGLSPSLLQGHGIMYRILYGGSQTLLEPTCYFREKKNPVMSQEGEKMAIKKCPRNVGTSAKQSRSTWLGWASSYLLTKLANLSCRTSIKDKLLIPHQSHWTAIAGTCCWVWQNQTGNKMLNSNIPYSWEKSFRVY